MNQKELNEIKKNFKNEEDNGLLTINKIVSAYVLPSEEDVSVIYKNTEIPYVISQERYDYIKMFFNATLKGKIGKNNKEYSITNSTTLSLFENTLFSRLNDEEQLDAFINQIIEGYEYISPYALFITHFTYSVLRKSNEDALEDTDELSGNSDDCNFMLVSICPIENTTDGLIFNDEFMADANIKKSVDMPVNGFLYPAFSDRQLDLNSILIFEKNVKKPNISIVDLCGATFTSSSSEQKEKFNDMLTDVIGKDLDFTLVTDINDAFNEKLQEQSRETEPPKLNKQEIIKTLIEAGVDPQNEEYLNKYYDSHIGDVSLDTNALVNKTSKMNTGHVSISYDNENANLISIKDVGGKKCIVITIDENVELNDILISR